jgi:hypothetical protein
MKRFLFPLFILCGLAFVGYVFYTFLKEKEIGRDPWTALPSESEVIIECNPIHNASSAFEAISGLQNIPAFSFIQTISSKFSSVELSQKISSNTGIFFISNDPSKAGFSVAVNKNFSISDISSKSTTTSFQGIEIHETEGFFFAVFDGYCIGANTASLIESSIISTQKNILSNELSTIRDKAARDAAISFYTKINDETWINLEIQSTVDNPKHLTGTAVSKNKKNRLFAIGSGNATPMAPMIPSTAEHWEMWINSDVTEAHSNIYTYLFPEEKKDYWSQAWLSIGDSCACDLNELWINRLSGNYGTFYLSQDSITKSVAFYEINDTTDWNVQWANIAATTSNGIYQFKYPDLFARYDNSSALTPHLFGIVKNGFIYAAEEESTITALKNTNDFQLPYSQKSSDKLALVWHGPLVLNAVLPSNFNLILDALGIREIQLTATETWPIIEYIRDGSETSPNENSNSQAEEPIQESNEPNEHSAIPNERSVNEWKVKNHKDNSTETIRQPSSGSLELLDATGKTLWQVAIDGEIKGEMMQIDALKNGKLQYLFVSGKKLYLLDRNGKNVGSFPLNLKESPSTGVYAFDYENNRNYRILVALEGGDVLNLTVDGTKTTGWNYQKSKTIHDIQFEKNGGNERLILTTKSGEKIKVKRNGTPG